MKTAWHLVSLLLTALLAPMVSAQSGVLELKVKVDEKQSGLAEVTTENHLVIQMTNRTSQDLGSLKVKYFLFAETLPDLKKSLDISGEKQVTLSPHGEEKITTEPAKTKFIPQHVRRSRTGARGLLSATTVLATGQKFSGYGVQVFQGDKLLEEQFVPSNLKDILNRKEK